MVAPLWPTFQPTTNPAAARPDPVPVYKKAPKWNFGRGDVDSDPAGRVRVADPIRAWVEYSVKSVLVQRGDWPIYTDRYGVDLRQAIAAGQEAVAFGILAEEITAQLLGDPRTRSVDAMRFQHLGEHLLVSFDLTSVTGVTEHVDVAITPI